MQEQPRLWLSTTVGTFPEYLEVKNTRDDQMAPILQQPVDGVGGFVENPKLGTATPTISNTAIDDH